MKKTLKFLGIIIVVFVILIALIFSIIYFMVWNNIGSESYNIVMEYGDEFTIDCDTQGKWFIHGDNSFYSRIQFFDKEEPIFEICNESGLRCYLVGDTVIIYKQNNSEEFEVFDENLYDNEKMTPVIKKVLLKRNNILRTYLPYFWDKYPYETRTMLQQLIDGEYDRLKKYGLSSDEQEVVSLSEIARDFINNNS